MKVKVTVLFFISVFCLLQSKNVNAQITLNFAEFDVFVKPIKANDTIECKVTQYYPDHLLKIYLKDFGGASYIELFDKNHKLVMSGNYVNGRDTLSKYKTSKQLGPPLDKKYYGVRLLKYIAPLRKGTWTTYNKTGGIIDKYEYEYKFWN